DTLQVVRELQKLRNVRYHDRPVSLYGGMHELPLIVTRPDGARWFDATTRERLTDGRFWTEVDSELSGVGEVMASLRQDLLGEETWERLVPAARLFIASAEKMYRDHRNDPAFDFSRSEEHTSELQSRENLVCRLLLEKKNKKRPP